MAAVALAAASACVREGRLPAARFAAVFATNSLMVDLLSADCISCESRGERRRLVFGCAVPWFSHPRPRPYPLLPPEFARESDLLTRRAERRQEASRSVRRAFWIGLVLTGIALVATSAGLASRKSHLPNGFHDSVILRGLNRPDAIRFASDGRVFVAEQGGEILVYKSIHAKKPTVFADLSREVNS